MLGVSFFSVKVRTKGGLTLRAVLLQPSRMNLRRFRWFFLLGALPVFAADPTAKIPPSPAQGAVSSSGKFTPENKATSTNDVLPRTPDEAEAVLNQALEIKQTGTSTFQIGLVELDREKRTVRFPAIICNRDQVIEYALVTTAGKTYESLLSTKASPMSIQLAFLLLGVSPVPVPASMKPVVAIPDANAVRIEVAWETNGVTTTVPLAKLICLTDGQAALGSPMTLDRWLYNGSEFDQWGFAARREGSLVALIRDPAALVNNPGADRDHDLAHLPNASLLPAQGTPVNLVLNLSAGAPLPPSVPLPGVTPVTPLSTNRN